ncbi:MerR family transcriptional regulator [Streptomyces sp. NPDC059063]|uniref:MerR family transcriptional regulator n=1 Tax=unclassified Streptomyces TaxID=2593676 RepID=UPI0036792450
MARRRGVSIGEAAALYGIAPSTVRWWESRGVLAPPAREGGKRVYGDTDLRRIGLAYLCCVVGRMPLDQAAVVTSGKATRDVWQDAIDAQIAQVERQIGQLEAARDYLRHCLSCTDDDIAGECPVLDSELAAHTPRGRARCDESVGVGPERDEKLCPGCRAPVTRPPRGRPRMYCSPACRQRAYRARRGRPSPTPSRN